MDNWTEIFLLCHKLTNFALTASNTEINRKTLLCNGGMWPLHLVTTFAHPIFWQSIQVS